MKIWKRPKKERPFLKLKQVWRNGNSWAIYMSLKELDHLYASPRDVLVNVADEPGIIKIMTLPTWKRYMEEEENGVQKRRVKTIRDRRTTTPIENGN